MRKKTSRALIAMSVLITGSLAYVGGAFDPSTKQAASDDATTTVGIGQNPDEPMVTIVEIDTGDTVAGFLTASTEGLSEMHGGHASPGQRGDGDPVTFLIEPISADGLGATPGEGDTGPRTTGWPMYSTPAVNQPAHNNGPGNPASPGGPGGPGTPARPGGPAAPGTPGSDPTGTLPPDGGRLPPGPLLADLPSNMPMLLDDVPGPLGTQPPGPYTPPVGTGIPGSGPGQPAGPSAHDDAGQPPAQDIAANRAAPGISVSSPSVFALFAVGLLGMLARRRRRD